MELEGAAVTRCGYRARCDRIRVFEAGHPTPDSAGLFAARHLSSLVAELTSDDLVISLITGGSSALLPAPASGLTLEDDIAVNTALLASGAPINVMNAIPKQILTVKGGRLAARAYPAPVVSLIVSDIPGDDPALVASDALRYVDLYDLKLPASVLQRMHDGVSDAPQIDDPRFARNRVHVIASASASLKAAATRAREHGIDAVILSDAIEGEARDIGSMHAAIAREYPGAIDRSQNQLSFT
jgi:hydroxypyruvate reductase